MKLASALTLALSLSLLGCGSSSSNGAEPTTASPAATPADEPAAPSQDIVDIAATDGKFETLVTAVKAAGLVEALKSDGPFTVFAPTDEAFAKLDEGVIDALLADTDKLQAVLKYHVVSGAVMSSDVVNLDSAATLQGNKVMIDATDGVRINNAKVIAADIRASNGVIHVIDTVLIPE
jgi:uncharacterized surface protein with fasciclin (FAS1) repeats